jgi:glycerol-3-phosphate dehydrogenase
LKRDIANLTDKEFDLVVVGAGIFGICVAWDAVLRGLSVALIDKGDFSHATSANHFKVVHGGIRYLQHGDLHRIRESSRERNIFTQIAPHLVYPLPFVIPTYGYGLKSKAAMQIALLLYDLCTYDRNNGIVDPDRQFPRGRVVSRQEALLMFPYLDKAGLNGAAIFHDGQMYNPPRLSLSFIKSIVAAGSVAVNYVAATGFIRSGNRVLGVKAHDGINGTDLEIRGKVVVNATGPWAKWLLQRDKAVALSHSPSFSRDAYFVVKRKIVADHALAVQGQTKDPDAILSRGNRHLFLVPWRDYTLIGVWHTVFDGEPESFTVTDNDLQEFVDEINQSYPGIDLSLDDVSLWNAGLTLFGENDSDAKDLSYGKRSIVLDHAKTHGIENLISVIGVRYTTARGIAESVVDRAFIKMGWPPPPSKSAVTPLCGGDFDNFQSLVSEIGQISSVPDNQYVIKSLAHNYGTTYRDVLHYVKQHAEPAKTVGDSHVLEAEIIHAVEEEMALSLADVLFRRTDLATGEFPGYQVVDECARLMVEQLGWSESERQKQVAQVLEMFYLPKEQR